MSWLTLAPSVRSKVWECVTGGEFSVTKWDDNIILELCCTCIFFLVSDTWFGSQNLHLGRTEVTGLNVY